MLLGEHALGPSRAIAEGLARLLPACRLMSVDGAGHMGPLTHAADVSALIVQHIAAVEADSDAPQPSCATPPAQALGARSQWL
jgi:pimeloyl-ACP methyl ester carboxylesterase